MVYECIKDFYVDLVDGNGFVEKEDGSYVRKGSMWGIVNNSINVIGAEIHLGNLTELEWIEISKKRLESHFRVVE